MRNLNNKKPATTAEIKILESTINKALPHAMKAFYRKHDGGRFDKSIYTHHGEDFRIQQFLSLAGNSDSIEETYKDVFLNNPSTPDSLLPFAADSGGDYFCLSLAPESFGAVIFFDSEYYDMPDRCQIFLARSFEDFIFNLKPDDE